MASAFKQMGWNSSQWQMLLGYLGPLVVEEKEGFRVLHNDVRVFLHGFLASQPPAACRQAASMLADHYLNPSSRRWFAHKSLRRLLRDAGREVEWARVFTVDWVFEAAALDITYADMSDDCVEALRQGTALKDWDVMLELACAAETLECWEQKCDSRSASARPEPSHSTPAFLHTELFVRPIAEWRVADLHDLIHDVELLLATGEAARARALLKRWLGGLSVPDLCSSAAGLVELDPRPGAEDPRLGMGERRTLESLGSACRSVNLNLKGTEPRKPVEHDALASFEAGWVQSSCGFGPFDSIAACFANRPLQYLGSYEAALRNLASSGHWPLVRDLMAQLLGSRDRLTSGFTAQAAWWALRSDAAVDEPGWLDILATAHFGFAQNSVENLDAAIAICQSLSWRDAAAEPGAIAQRVFDALRIDQQRHADLLHYKLLFRAAATLGRVWSVIHRRNAEAAGQILPPNELAMLTDALWSYRFHGITCHRDRLHAGQFAMDLVDVAFQLGNEHLHVLVETANPVVEQCPVDFRRESVWRLFQRSGDIPRLQSWVKQWLADDGELWKEDASSRESIAEDLLPLARQLGENELADQAEERLRWLQITYRGHKEYTFNTPISWFRELAGIEPASWRDIGLKLWVLSEACSALGGDDCCGWEFGKELGTAAWRCGPADVWQLLTTEYAACGSEYWFHPTANRIIGGLSQRLRCEPHLPWRDRLAGWCLAVGLSRWFDDESIKSLDRLRETLLDTADDESERILISTAIERLTPGEFQRRPRPDTAKRVASSTSVVDEGLDIWLERTAKGEEVHPCTAARLLRNAQAERPTDFREIAEKILTAVGVGAPYGWGWDLSGSLQGALVEIGRLVPDDVLWKLVSAAVKYAGDGSAWTQGVGRNLYSVLLSRASKHGQPTLRAGISRILGMHEQWARGGRNELELPLIKLGTAEPIASWTELAARSLAFLLASRSAEVIESALVGVHSLAAHDPNAVGLFVQLAKGNLWKQYWILNAAEVWAALFPEELESSRAGLEGWLETGPLHQRLQTWIVLCRLAQRSETRPPPFPYPSIVKGNGHPVLHQPQRDLMSTPATQHGSIRFVDLHHAAESIIKRVEHVTSLDLSPVKSAVAEGLRQASRENFTAEPWPVRIRCSGDMQCSPLLGNQILDEGFDEFMRSSPLPESLGSFFAQAYLGNENPWTLRATPVPDASQSNWPGEGELRGTNQKPADIPEIRRKLLLLATRHAIADDEMALAARVQVFTYLDDFIFRLWWQEGSPDSMEVMPEGCPTTLSGRTFAFDFEDWWEPYIKPGKRPLTYAVGGQQRLTLCFPEFMPAKLWRSEFGWRPAMEYPLVWLAENQPVARYEFIHGTPRFTHSSHPRQPVIGRWVVKKSAWERVEKSHGLLRMRDDFQHFSSDVEH